MSSTSIQLYRHLSYIAICVFFVLFVAVDEGACWEPVIVVGWESIL